MAKKSFSNPFTNELKGSPWFKHPESTEDVPAPDADDHPTHQDSSNQQQKTERPNGRTTERPNGEAKQVQRLTKRHSFEIYQDQWERFQKLRAQALLRGEQFNMSAIVREAIDTALKRLERE